jgi:CO/xanthine dehydrogenase Mo-binding subunit
LETVGAVAQYDSASGKFTIHANTSMYNYIGWTMALSLGVPAHRLNVVPVIAGGSFGSKLFVHKVCVLAASLARICGRPVKYVEDRIDNIMACDNHGSDRIYDAELALDGDNQMIGLRLTSSMTMVPISSSASATTATLCRRSLVPIRSGASI